MELNVKKQNISKEIDVIPSKSYLIRYLFLSAFSDDETVIENVVFSDDVKACINVLEGFGAKVSSNGSSVTVTPTVSLPESVEVDVFECATVLRFTLCIMSVLGIEGRIFVHGNLIKRSVKDFLTAVKSSSVKLKKDGKGYLLTGKFDDENVVVSCGETSQFVSGFILAYAIKNTRATVRISGEKNSYNYVFMTVDAVSLFRGKIALTDGVATVDCKSLISPRKIAVEGDWTTASFYLILGALVGGITVKNVNLFSRQGDKTILNILSSAGIDTHIDDKGLTPVKNAVKAFSCDVSACPDLFIELAVFAGFSDGICVFTGVKRLKDKESDRVKTTYKLLNTLGVKCKMNGNEFKVFGGGFHGGTVDSYGDHRVVLGAVTVGTVVGGVTVTNAECVSKSYPNLFEDMELLDVKTE